MIPKIGDVIGRRQDNTLVFYWIIVSVNPENKEPLEYRSYDYFPQQDSFRRGYRTYTATLGGFEWEFNVAGSSLAPPDMTRRVQQAEALWNSKIGQLVKK